MLSEVLTFGIPIERLNILTDQQAMSTVCKFRSAFSKMRRNICGRSRGQCNDDGNEKIL